jgi:hypothetical protein
VKLETVQPLFRCLEGGLFIHQANEVADQVPLRLQAGKTSGVIPGTHIGRLDRRQILRLLTIAVSRLIGNLPHNVSNEDYWVHGTIRGLYRAFCEPFLKQFPHQPEERTLWLTSFLDRIVENQLGQPLSIEYSALNRERWQILIEAGDKLLEYQFPVIHSHFFPELRAPSGEESDRAWLTEARRQLRLETERERNLQFAEQFDRRDRPGWNARGRGLGGCLPSRRQGEKIKKAGLVARPL